MNLLAATFAAMLGTVWVAESDEWLRLQRRDSIAACLCTRIEYVGETVTCYWRERLVCHGPAYEYATPRVERGKEPFLAPGR